MIEIAARGIRAVWEPGCGHLPVLEIAGQPVLHAAPWRDEAAIASDASIPLVDRRLGGTFVCAPFGGDDVDHGPPHGLSANAPWDLIRHSPQSLTARRRLSRGQITGRLTVRDGHPVLYQQHVLELERPCTFAHHPMVRVAGGARITVSGASSVHTFDAAEEPGRDVYLRGQASDGGTLQTRDGPRDWRDYPDQPCEDFLAVVGPRKGVGWTAVQRWAEGDTILFLKRCEQLPLTCLWLSNGGRDHAPWNGRHRGVLGVEDAVCAGADGFAAALSAKGTIADTGVPTVLPEGRHVIPHALARLPGCHGVEKVELEADCLRVTTAAEPLTIPFEGGHLS